MDLPLTHTTRRVGRYLPLAVCALWAIAGKKADAQASNPISRIARVFDPQLVKVEDRVTWLEGQIATYSQRCDNPLKVGIGYRGCRNEVGGPDPTITMDLGKECPIEAIYLVPAQLEYPDDPGIFPKRFTLEISNAADFSQRTILYTSSSATQQRPAGYPVQFKTKDTARYVRLSVQEGTNKGILDLFGLSEFVVISNGNPISFGASVTTVGGLDAPGSWYPQALIDGRMPLGIWQNGTKPRHETGDSVTVSSSAQKTSWKLDLDKSTAVDRLILFPYQVNRSFETSVFPESFEVWSQADADSPAAKVFEWKNPVPGASTMTPLVIPLHALPMRGLQVIATGPWSFGGQKIHALSEIEVWSGAKNLAKGRPVTRESGDRSLTINSLTDGYSSEKEIIPMAVWLHQLNERGRNEQELASLRSVHQKLSSNSELNATWGSAVILGLTFLIPVFIVERRRLMSKEQLDQIRKRIASDLHDDIGSNLGSISLIARTARKDLVRLQGPDEIAQDLGEVETIARESSLAMRDIVWLLERRQDSIGDLVQRMRETANRLLREIDFTLECESSRTAAKLTLDAKRHLFLFYKEAIHNVLKHSKANNVSIRLWDEDDKLALEILDNGVGLPTGKNDRPHSVSKLEDRARVLDGLLQIASSGESGTRIRLLVKRSHLTSRPSMS